MPINIRSPDGTVISVPESEIDTWTFRGYTPVTEEDTIGRETRQGLVDSVADPVSTFVGSAASGATLGLTDYLFADDITQISRSANPGLATAGQIAGAVVPSLLAPGSGAAAGIAKYTPAGAASLLGAKVTALGAQGGRLAQVGAMAAGAGIEGAAQMAGQYMAETAIKDKPLTAEGFVGAMGKGALFGAGIGGAVGLVAQGATSARKLFARSEVTEVAAKQASAAASQRARKAMDAGDEGVMIGRRRMMEIELESPEAAAAAAQARKDYPALIAEQKLRAQTAAADIAERQAKDVAERGAPLTPAEIKAQTAQRLADIKVKGAEQDMLRKSAEADAKFAAMERELEQQLKAKGATAAQKIKTQKALDKVKIDRAKAAAKTGGKAPRSTAPKAELVDQTDDLINEVPIGMVDDMPPMGAVDEFAPPVAAADEALPQPAAIAAEEAALPTLEDFVDDAVARVSPEAAGIVKATRDYKRARLGMTQIDEAGDIAARATEASTKGKRQPWTRETEAGMEWRVTAPKNKGHIWITSEELSKSTNARIRDAFENATPSQRAYIESMMPPKRVEAIRGLEAGELQHMPGYFNRDHHWDGRVVRLKELAESDDVLAAQAQVHEIRRNLKDYKHNPSYFREKDGGALRDWSAEKPFVDQYGDVYHAETLRAIGVIGDYDKSLQGLGKALGNNAPQSLADEVAELMEQVAKSEDGDLAAMAAHLDDTAGQQAIDEATRIARGSDPNIKPPDDMMPPSAGAANSNAGGGAGAADNATPAAARVMDPEKAMANVMPPDVDVPKGGAGKALGWAADAGAALEAIQMVGGLPGVPRINDIPLIGPLLSTFLKARAAWGIFRRVGGKIPTSVEGNVAMKAAAARDRIRSAADKLMQGVEQGARAAKRVAIPASASLERVLYSSGASVSSGGGLPARLSELAIAANDPQGVEKRIREKVPSADAELVAQIIEVAQRKLSFLQDKAPKDPRPPTMLQTQFMPSKAHTETFARYVRAADDPATVFEDAADGYLNTEGVEALRAIYPRLYQESQSLLMERADKLQQTLPYSRRLLLGSLFDVPIDGTMTPEYRSAMAAASQAGGPQQGNAPQQGVAPSIAGSAAKVAQMADPNSNRKRGAM